MCYLYSKGMAVLNTCSTPVTVLYVYRHYRGFLKIAEVASRFENVRSFITALANLGFKMLSKVRQQTTWQWWFSNMETFIFPDSLFCIMFKLRCAKWSNDMRKQLSKRLLLHVNIYILDFFQLCNPKNATFTYFFKIIVIFLNNQASLSSWFPISDQWLTDF